MSAFEQARTVEALALSRLLPFLKERSFNGQLVLPNKGALARHLQETAGDVLLNSDDAGRLWSIEIKAEAERRHDNFFLETWSNRNLDDQRSHASRGSNPGWMFKLNSELLFYYFLNIDELFVIDLFRLQQWAFGTRDVAPRIWAYPQKMQSKYTQMNDTWGACVPIAVIGREVGFKRVNPRQIPLFEDAA